MNSRSRLLAASCAAACLAVAIAAAPAFAAGTPAWSPVAASGPTNLPPLQSETQRVGVDAEGGNFTLTGHHSVGRGTASFSGGSIGSNFTINSGSFSVGQAVVGKAIPPGTTIESIGATTITLSAAPAQSGLQELFAVDASETTGPLPFDADASEVEAALEALSTIGGAGASVTVAGGPGGQDAAHPYLVSFGGSLANVKVAPLSANASALTGSGHSATVITTVPGGPGTGMIAIYAQNVGGIVSSGTITLSVTLPDGVTTSATPAAPQGGSWTCSPGAGQEDFTCTSTAAVAPGGASVPLNAPVVTGAGAASGTVQVEVSDGGALAPASYPMPLTVSSTPAGPGIQAFTAGAYDADGNLDTRAGGHPYAGSTAILVNTYRNHFGIVVPAGEFKDIEVDLPPGFLGNPIATPQCPEVELSVKPIGCEAESIVGNAAPILGFFGTNDAKAAVYNVEAPFGYPGKFFFEVAGVPIHAVGSLRSDGDYGLSVGSLNTAQLANVYGAFFTFWGAPAAEEHDAQRCTLGEVGGPGFCPAPVDSTAPNTSLLTSPTNCAEQASIAASNGGLIPVVLRITTWQSPLITHTAGVGVPPVTQCEELEFKADFTFEPSDTKSDSTASFRTSLTVPSEGLTNPEKLTTPEIKDTVVTLPKGVVLNASGADGLEACSLQQIGFKGSGFSMPNPMRFNKNPNTCPEASKIGTGELKTALLADPLKGNLYLAAQGKGNPFGTLFAIYLVIEDPRHGIVIKLPGRVDPDPVTGQMEVTFDNLPQLPFTRLDLTLKGGNRSALASPTTCGSFITTATNTPWSAPESGPPTVSANGFAINQGPNGQPCAQTMAERPFDLGWNAGAESTKAGASGPFQMQITRPDGSQELDGLELTTPKGLSASLKGIPYCSAAQIAQAQGRTGKEELAGSSCPVASKVGTLTTGAGSGPSPFYVTGNLYLAGPYKGAPISVVAITPAVAGPFDLGNVVVRAAVNINRTSAQVTAKSDPIPQILKGVVLRIKDVRIKLDRKDWTINPTSCEASTVNLKATGNSGATAERSVRFQVGGCKDLAFKPRLKAHLTGGTRRGAHPAFTAAVTYPPGPGYANTRDVQVTLPHSEFLDQAHINTICTRVQAAANACPKGSIYGFAEARTPLIDGKLTGPVFLKSSNHQLPDLAISLRGPDSQPLEVEFQGRIDSIKAQIRNTIEGLPDVPVSKFVLKMKGGKKGLLVNSRNLCAGKVTRMTVKMTGQSNQLAQSRPPLTRKCKGKAAGKAKKGRKAAKRRSAGTSRLIGAW